MRRTALLVATGRRPQQAQRLAKQLVLRQAQQQEVRQVQRLVAQRLRLRLPLLRNFAQA
jgi:hypothetical protein